MGLQHRDQVDRKTRIHGVPDGETMEINNPHESLNRWGHFLAALLQKHQEVREKSLGLPGRARGKATVNTGTAVPIEADETSVVASVINITCRAPNLAGFDFRSPLDCGCNAL